MASKKQTKDSTTTPKKKTTKPASKSATKATNSNVKETKTSTPKAAVKSLQKTAPAKAIESTNAQSNSASKSTNASATPKALLPKKPQSVTNPKLMYQVIVTVVILVLVTALTAGFSYYRSNLRNQTPVQEFTTGSLDRPYEIPQEFLDTRVCGEEGSGTELTKSFPEGEYYVPNPPRRDLLIDVETESNLLVLVGQVFDQECKPIAGAIVDIWHANPEGAFSLTDDSYRGYVFSDSKGIYIAQTYFPGADKDTDAGKIHFKIRANVESPVLTTQVFASIVNTDSHPTLPASQKVEVTEQQQGTYIGSYSFVVEKK